MSSPPSEAILARRSSLDAWYEAYGHGASLREDMWQAVTLNERVPRGRFISLIDCSCDGGSGSRDRMLKRGLPRTTSLFRVLQIAGELRMA